MKIEKNKSLKNNNTFGIDVCVRKYIEIYDEEELKQLLSLSELKDVPKLVLGGGSNILVDHAAEQALADRHVHD